MKPLSQLRGRRRKWEGWRRRRSNLRRQHLDFGTTLEFSPLDGFGPCPPGVNCRNITAVEDIFRVRLSAKINPFGGAPVVAKY